MTKRVIALLCALLLLAPCALADDGELAKLFGGTEAVAEDDSWEIFSASVNGFDYSARSVYDLDVYHSVFNKTTTVVCRDASGEVVWSRETVVDAATELSGSTAFMAGVAQDPLVALYNVDEGLWALDGLTGEERWFLSTEDAGLGGGICAAVDENGTMYIGGYDGPDPVAISMDGRVLWRSDCGSDDFDELGELRVTEEGLLASYEWCGGRIGTVCYALDDGRVLWTEVDSDVPWREEYEALLNDWTLDQSYAWEGSAYLQRYFGDNYGFDRYACMDVNGDGTPELFLCSTTMGLTHVYTCSAYGVLFLVEEVIEGVNPAESAVIVRGHWHGAGGSQTDEYQVYVLGGADVEEYYYFDLLWGTYSIGHAPHFGEYEALPANKEAYDALYNRYVAGMEPFSLEMTWPLDDFSGLDAFGSGSEAGEGEFDAAAYDGLLGAWRMAFIEVEGDRFDAESSGIDETFTFHADRTADHHYALDSETIEDMRQLPVTFGRDGYAHIDYTGVNGGQHVEIRGFDDEGNLRIVCAFTYEDGTRGMTSAVYQRVAG